jgi:hypothetical protein
MQAPREKVSEKSSPDAVVVHTSSGSRAVFAHALTVQYGPTLPSV